MKERVIWKNGSSRLFYPSAFQAVFTNLNATGRYGPTTLGSHYTGQDHDGQVTLSSGIQQWNVPYTGDYRIEAIGAAGGYDRFPSSAQYRGRGAIMMGTFRLNKGEVIQIIVGQEGGVNKLRWSSGGGGGTFVVRGANTPLMIAGGGGGVRRVESRHKGCDASTQTAGNPGYKSWSGGSNGHGARTADNSSHSGKNILSCFLTIRGFRSNFIESHVSGFYARLVIIQFSWTTISISTLFFITFILKVIRALRGKT